MNFSFVPSKLQTENADYGAVIFIEQDFIVFDNDENQNRNLIIEKLDQV